MVMKKLFVLLLFVLTVSCFIGCNQTVTESPFYTNFHYDKRSSNILSEKTIIVDGQEYIIRAEVEY